MFVFLRGHVPYFLKQDLSLNLKHLIQLGTQISELQGYECLHIPSSVITAPNQRYGFWLHLQLESKVRFTCLCD